MLSSYSRPTLQPSPLALNGPQPHTVLPPILASEGRAVPACVCHATLPTASRSVGFEQVQQDHPSRRATRRSAPLRQQRHTRQQQQQQQQQHSWQVQGSGVDYGCRSLAPKELTAAITAAASIHQLHRVCSHHRAQLNYIHAAAAVTKLAKLGPSPPPGDPHTEPGALPASPREHEPAPLTDSDAETVRSSQTPAPLYILHPPSPQQQQQQRQYSPADCRCLTDIAYTVATHAAEFQPRALANALWAASKLAQQLAAGMEGCASAQQQEQPLPQHPEQQQQQPQQPQQQQGEGEPLPPWTHTALTAVLDLAGSLCSHLPQLAPGFEPQHCSNALHGLANLQRVVQVGVHVPPGTPQAYQQEQQLRECASCVLGETTPPQLAHMSPQGLANTLHAVAWLDLCPDEAWMDAWLDAAQAKLPLFEPQHVSNSLWALARLSFYPGDDWVEGALQAAQLKLPAFTPQGLANSLWALAVLQSQPPQSLLVPILETVLEQAPSFDPQDSSNALWALAKLQPLYSPSSGQLATLHTASAPAAQQQQETAGVDHLTAAVVQRLVVCGAQDPQAAQNADPQELSNSVWAVSCLRPLLLSTFPPTPPLSPDPHPSPAPSPSHAAHASTHLLVSTWLHHITQASLPKLPHFNSQELATLLIGLARCSQPPRWLHTHSLPPEWWAHTAHASRLRLPAGEVQHAVSTLWALAVLGYKPGGPWARALCRKVLQCSDELSAPSLALVLWSLARLRLQPGRRWVHTLLAPQRSRISNDRSSQRIREHRRAQLGGALQTPHGEVRGGAAIEAPAEVSHGQSVRGSSSARGAADEEDDWEEQDRGAEIEAACDEARWQGASLRQLAMSLWALPRLGLMGAPERSVHWWQRGAARRARATGRGLQGGLSSVQQQQQGQIGELTPLQGGLSAVQQQQQGQIGELTPLQVRQLLRAQQEQQEQQRAQSLRQEQASIENRLRNDGALLRPLLTQLHRRLSSLLKRVRQQRRQQRRERLNLDPAVSGAPSPSDPAPSSAYPSPSAGKAESLSEDAHAVAVAVRALARMNRRGGMAPLMSRGFMQTLDDACVLCMPRWGGVALSAVMGGLAQLGTWRPSASLTSAAMRRASELQQAGGLSSWQLVMVVHAMAAMRLPLSAQWLQRMLRAWKSMRQSQEQGGGGEGAAVWSGLEELEGEVPGRDDVFTALEGDAAVRGRMREHAAMRQVARTYSLISL